MAGTSSCGSCGAPILWAIHVHTRKRAPYNAAPDPLGLWILELERGELVAQYVGPNATLLEAPTGERFTPHFATCPHAELHRG